jgi:hypothetical protein
MCVTNAAVSAAECAPYEPFTVTKAWRLADGPNGYRTVFVFLRDTRGNTMAAPARDTIILQAPAGVAPDTTPPTGAVQINGGAATTPSAAVNLTVSASDPSGVAAMCVSNAAVSAAACAPFEPYAGLKQWRLADGGDGARTVYVFLQDAVGNTMATPVQAYIILQTPADAPDTVGRVHIIAKIKARMATHGCAGLS